MQGTALLRTLKGSEAVRKLFCKPRVEREQTEAGGEVGCRKAAGQRQSDQRW